MNSDLQDLYQEVILEHGKSPRNYGALEGATKRAHGDNPLCGDQVEVYVTLDGDSITDVSFEGHGCAISQASASLMTLQLKGKDLAEARDLFERFHAMVTGKVDDEEGLGKLAVLKGVRQFPTRIKCATLAWHTFNAALEGADQPVTTE